MKIAKHILFILFFCVFLSELIINHTQFFSFKKLNGQTIREPQPKFTLDNWLNGDCQEQQMKFFEQNLDIRPFLIRFRNQLGYSIFNELNAPEIEVGKNQVLFGSGYIESYMGQNFIGEDKIINKVNMLAYVQDELKKRNVDLIFVIAPGKPSVFPEYLPEKYDLRKKKRSNYDAFAEQLEKQKINHIDFSNYFLKLKPKSKYPLFTRCGVHWSGYASTIAADSLVKYMEKLSAIDLLNYHTEGGQETTVPRSTDADLGDLLNLTVDIPSHEMYYPNIVFEKNSKKKKPNVLIIGDSFVWSWISFYNFFPNLFNEKSAFWYYNHEVAWSPTDQNKTLTASLNLKEETTHRDFILIVNAESSLNNAGQFFIEQMFEMLHKDTLNTNSILPTPISKK